jgi:sporulation protein YlmC with PRC-barrel domain
MSVTKDQIEGLEVYDAQGHLKGTVKDIAFTVGTESLSIVIGKDKDAPVTIPWKKIQAIGEIVILKPEEPQQQAVCPSCGGPLRYIEPYKRWYCDKEKKYA